MAYVQLLLVMAYVQLLLVMYYIRNIKSFQLSLKPFL